MILENIDNEGGRKLIDPVYTNEWRKPWPWYNYNYYYEIERKRMQIWRSPVMKGVLTGSLIEEEEEEKEVMYWWQ